MSPRFEGGRARPASPRFTIITASFNQGRFIEETIQSVLRQGRDDIEHLVFDGGSTDETIDILRQYNDSLAYWVSAPDEGQAAAWNAGVERARGDVIGILNSDDLYLPGGLDRIAQLADASSDANWLIGGTRYFGAGSGDYPGQVQKRASDVMYFVSYAPQPGQFFRRRVFDQIGRFDESLRYAFDLDFWVRCALAGVRSAATPDLVSAFRLHAASKTISESSRMRAESDKVEARYWPEIAARDGRHAWRVRSFYNGHHLLTSARDALTEGDRRKGWRLLAATARDYPRMLLTRAFAGTVQRLLGLRWY